jgi:hypothetical protein
VLVVVMVKKTCKKISPSHRLRSQAWFDNPANADMTALYVELGRLRQVPFRTTERAP